MEYQKVISSRKYLECKYDENGKEIVINNWSKDVNSILDKIRINSILLSNEHKKSYFLLSSKLKWFRIPMIVLSSIGSIFNVGLPTYIGSTSVEIICAIIALFVSLIGSMELFLAISTKMESELIQSKELYLLAIEIEKTLLLDSLHRNGDGIAYLEDRFNMYSKLIENSQLLECRIIDELTPLPDEYIKKIIPNINIFFQKHSKSRNSSTNGKSPKRLDIRSFHNQLFMKGGLFPKQNTVVPENNTKPDATTMEIHQLLDRIQNDQARIQTVVDQNKLFQPTMLKQLSARNRQTIYRSVRQPEVIREPSSRMDRYAILRSCPETNEQILDNARFIMEQSSNEVPAETKPLHIKDYKNQNQPRRRRISRNKNKTMRVGHRKFNFSGNKDNSKLNTIGSDDTSVALDVHSINASSENPVPPKTNLRRSSITNALRRSFEGGEQLKHKLNKLGRRSLDRISIDTNMKMTDAAQLIPEATELLSQIRKFSNDSATATNVRKTLSNYPENTPYNKMQNVIIYNDVYKNPPGDDRKN